MRLLKAVPDSMLWLLDGSATDTLRREARERGVDEDRLIFAPPVKQELHLARLSLADLVLDTLPYNAHTTASDALWAGVPIVTCRGRSFAGRVAASILSAIGLFELITEDAASYEAMALRLATIGSHLQSIRSQLATNKLTAPLFDAERFCLNIEKAFATMVSRARSGSGPAGFDVMP
jgi:predicted O-linked N-acetylglucosamine transferase (SPINDLY family)